MSFSILGRYAMKRRCITIGKVLRRVSFLLLKTTFRLFQFFHPYFQRVPFIHLSETFLSATGAKFSTIEIVDLRYVV